MKRLLGIILFVGVANIINSQELFPRRNGFRLTNCTFTAYSGVFIPTQSARVLGNHGMIGFGFGGLFGKNSIDLLVDFKLGKSRESYQVFYMDSTVMTDLYKGMYFGLEYARTLFRINKSEYYMSVGLGAEDITAIMGDAEENKKNMSLISPNYNIGIGYRYRLNHENRLSIQFRYQYLDFHNERGTELNGNSYTIRLKWIFDIPRLIPYRHY